MSANPAILPKTPGLALPDMAALCVGARQAAILTREGEILTLPHAQARQQLMGQAVLVCHAPYTRARLDMDDLNTLDVLELFAFVHPTRFCVPTPAGLAKALGLPHNLVFEDAPYALFDCARALLTDLRADPLKDKASPLDIAAAMGQRGRGWGWTPYVFSALGQSYAPGEEVLSRIALNVWKHLPEWAEDAPQTPSAHAPVSEEEARARLSALLARGDKPREMRPQQQDYTAAITKAFAPVEEENHPHIVLAEAGTGIGKTLGYLAPASVWAEKNEGSVWISTYTKNLQRQIDEELDRLYPDRVVKDAYVTLRKGRENYLCLLNFEDLAAGAGVSVNPRHAIAAGIMARWIAATKTGDLSGVEFPGWLGTILGFANSQGLSDRRGECIYSACDHYHRCFIERSVRKSKRARLVIANHALVMIQSALATGAEILPARYIFDEGHHLFDAADGAFAAHLTAREMAELRRWIRGAEEGRKSRARGLKKRVEDLLEGDAEGTAALQDIIHAAGALCSAGWSRRLKEGETTNVGEGFIAALYKQIQARSTEKNAAFSLETETHRVTTAALEAAEKLKSALMKILKPTERLMRALRRKLAEDQGQMEADARKRLDSLTNALESRAAMTLRAWIAMLETLSAPEKSAGFIDWMEIERLDGQSVDIGLYRHHIDPMKPFTDVIAPHLQGMAVTSATLKDGSEDEAVNWMSARERSGALYFRSPALESQFTSPFDYAQKTKVFVLTDVNKNDLAQVSGAYQALFTASGGGALGLFTAIQRLRAVYAKIAGPLDSDGLNLYAQHVDDMDTGTLVDIFREDTHACLLGTDAVRDGVDVPGDSLRLIVFDRVPWPRPSILHKARRNTFGGRRYDEMLTRLKLKQAFGRLIRRETDKGVFVMLDSALPSRLHGAFPPGVAVQKCGLSEATQSIKDFFA